MRLVCAHCYAIVLNMDAVSEDAGVTKVKKNT
jgi:hypothetical protein